MIHWLTVADAAEHIKAGETTIREALHKGDLPASRVGRSIRIDAADLDAWLKGQTWEPRA